MIVAPETEIYLLKTPLQIDELQQMDFASTTAQANYFQSCPSLPLMNATYQRENDTMYVNFNIEAIRSYNYVMYKNKQYSNKWFYAFIAGMQYESNTCTAIQIKTDVFQTYMFEYQLKDSYILRETVDDDTYGKHLIGESFDLGDYILKSTDVESFVSNTQNYNNKSALIVIQCSERLGVVYNNAQYQTEYEDMYIIGGLPQGCWYYMFYNTAEQLDAIRQFKRHLDSIGKGNAILNMFLVPQQVVDTKYGILRLYDREGNLSDNYISCYIADGNTYLPKTMLTKTVARPTNFGTGNNTFTPRNNKTLTYPYTYLLVINGGGGALDFHYEDFKSDPVFKVIGTLSANTPYYLQPNNSKKSANSEYGLSTETLQGTPLPTMSWDSDYYLNYMAQNGHLNGIALNETIDKTWTGMLDRFASSLVGFGMNNYDPNIYDALPEAGYQASYGLFSSITNIVYQGARMEEQNKVANSIPNTVKGNMGAGDLSFAMAVSNAGYKFMKFEVRVEIAKKVDKYFDMFGYRVNEIKTPNTKTRRYWNYLETEKVNLEGDIPQEALQELKAIYNAGITIWHDPAHFLDYSLTNSIL